MADDDLGTVRWFGVSWLAPINDPRTEIPTPVGELCLACNRPIAEYDDGVTLPSENARVAYHIGCFFRELGIDRYVPGL